MLSSCLNVTGSVKNYFSEENCFLSIQVDRFVLWLLYEASEIGEVRRDTYLVCSKEQVIAALF